MNKKNSNTNQNHPPDLISRFRTGKRSRRFGWMSVFFAVAANAMLFFSINWVNSAPETPSTPENTVFELFTPQMPERPAFPKTAPAAVEPKKIITAAPKPVLLTRIEQHLEKPRLTEWVPDSLMELPGVTMNISASEPVQSDYVNSDPFAPMDIGRVDTPPTKISGRSPTYPRWARPDRAEGTVTLRFVIGLDGKVSNVEVRRIKGDPRFAEAAVWAVKNWRFKPAIDKSRPVAVWAIQTVSFKYQGRNR